MPDNLKTGVIKNTRAELVLNKAYQELAEHYGTAIMPARVRTPKDKATVEGSVRNISSFILTVIRNQKFFTLRELNETIRERLYAFNHKPFQKKDGSRATWFGEKRVVLLPLPRDPFELAVWKIATVAFNYHIGVDEQFYSVPFEFIKRKVDVRLHGRRRQYSTQEAHMLPDHQKNTRNGTASVSASGRRKQGRMPPLPLRVPSPATRSSSRVIVPAWRC
ncbi:MAG: hypothetical protein FWC27_05500 [Firmicutes bacterium]|nr:hypothetical protein [Bacillota bacterium]